MQENNVTLSNFKEMKSDVTKQIKLMSHYSVQGGGGGGGEGGGGAPVAQWVKRWSTDLADRVRSSLEVKSSQP